MAAVARRAAETQRAQQPTRAAKMSCPHMLARVPAFAHLRSGSPACSARLRRMPLRVCHTTSQLAATCNPECPAQRIDRLCRALVVPPSSVVSMLAHYFDASRDESCAKLKHCERMPRMKCDEDAHPHTELWPPRKGSLARSQAPRLPSTAVLTRSQRTRTLCTCALGPQHQTYDGASAVDAVTEVPAIRNPNLQQSAAARCRENAVPGELRTHRLGLTCDRRMISMSAFRVAHSGVAASATCRLCSGRFHRLEYAPRLRVTAIGISLLCLQVLHGRRPHAALSYE